MLDRREVTSEDIKALRKELRCTTRELAAALGLDHAVVMAWEDEEQFPTKRSIKLMERLRAEGPGSVPRKRRGRKKGKDAMQVLADPELWGILRKLLVHEDLRRQVVELSSHYDDPNDT